MADTSKTPEEIAAMDAWCTKCEEDGYQTGLRNGPLCPPVNIGRHGEYAWNRGYARGARERLTR